MGAYHQSYHISVNCHLNHGAGFAELRKSGCVAVS